MKKGFWVFMVSLCFVLVAGAAFGQYPATGNKQRLGFQTTGDGLTWRGSIGDTATIDPIGIANAWMLIDTVTGYVYAYRAKRWQIVTALPYMPFDSVTFNDNQGDADSAELKYNADIGSLVYGGNDGTQIPVLPGHWYVRNDDTVTLTKGTVVMETGTLGTSGRIKAKRMVANGSVPAMYILGIVAKDIPIGEDGYVMWQGKLRKVNTNVYAPGTVLYADWFTPGGLTDFLPAAPNLKLPIAFVVNQGTTNGVIAVRVTAGEYLRELHDVDVGGATKNDILRYDGSTWVESKDTSIYDYDAYLKNNRTVLLNNFSLELRDSMNKPDKVQIRDTYVGVEDTILDLHQNLFKYGLFSFQQNNTLQSIIHNYDGNISLRANTSATTTPSIDPDLRILGDGKISFRLSAGGSPDSLYAKNSSGYLTAIKNTLGDKLNASDTASLSSRIDAKLSISDTAAMLAPYLTAETPQELSTSNPATNAAAVDLSGPLNVGEAIIAVDANNATPWDGLAVVGIILQFQSRVIFTGAGGIEAVAVQGAYGDTVRISLPDTSITGDKTRFTGIAGHASKLLGVHENGKTDTVALGASLTLSGGVLSAVTGGGGTVTSVQAGIGLTVPSGFSNPITATGTIIADTNFLVTVNDTASMLANYINVTDTASMLSTYISASDTASMLSTYINFSDTSTIMASKVWVQGRGYLTSEVDGSVTNEGSLTVGAGTATTSVINSNTSGSTGVTLTAGTGLSISENIGTGTITLTNTGPSISGTPSSGQVTYFSGASQIEGTNNFFYETGDIELGIGISTPTNKLHLNSSSASNVFSQYTNTNTGTAINDGLQVGIDGNGDGYVNHRESKSLSFRTENLTRVNITNGGNILIGRDGTDNPSLIVTGLNGDNTALEAPNIRLQDSETSGDREWMFQIDGSTQLATFYYNGTSWTKTGYQTTGGTWTNSDFRRKENIIPLNYGLSEIMQLKPKKYNFRIDERKLPYMGFIAQDVLPVIPDAVQSDIDGKEQYYAMDYANLVPVLVKAIQEQQAQIEQQRKLIEELIKRISQLENK